PYPFGAEKVGVVETPHLGMEHQTINAYGNAYKQAPEGFDWLFQHEFSHEWFGNQLTNRDWDDMWLHEGFGTYMQPLYAEWRGGRMAYDAWLWKIRGTIMNRHAIVTGTHRTEEQVYDKTTGPGLDIYNKGAWILHSLRGLIGDEAFFRSVRRLVYGRPDPAPGNFAPRFGSTDEFVAIASQESKRDLSWFFDVYLRHARLPLLDQHRAGGTLSLQWRTPGGLPFPMPVEVSVDGQLQTLAMSGGKGQLTLPSPQAHVIIDPNAKILRQSDDMDRFRDWTEADKARTTGAKS
ncbi:MAG: M1 family peptidase, partial [Pseudomonadota bacterium]|nr:M1 family peptidase [Pseudomonadota bacterium]